MTGTDNKRRSILVANDDSAGARTASDAAIRIARSQALAILGLYVVDEALALGPGGVAGGKHRGPVAPGDFTAGAHRIRICFFDFNVLQGRKGCC